MSPIAWVQIIVGLFTAAGGIGAVVAVLKVRPESRKLNADATKAGADAAAVIGQAAAALLEPATREAARLATRLQEAENKIDQLERQVDSLTDRLRLAHRLLSEAGIPFPPVPEAGG